MNISRIYIVIIYVNQLNKYLFNILIVIKYMDKFVRVVFDIFLLIMNYLFIMIN